MTDWQTLPGLVRYQEGLELMEKQLTDVISGGGQEKVFLLEHDHVYTAGTNAKDEELLDSCDIPVIPVGRGGKYTYHGPGQRVIYPIIDLRKPNRQQDLKLYVKQLEQLIIATLSRFGLECYIIPDKIGIWTDIKKPDGILGNVALQPAKIAAIGIRVRKWVTYHGIAVNICNDLDMYKGIIPCGISEFPVTSMCELDRSISMSEFDSVLKQEFIKIFE